MTTFLAQASYAFTTSGEKCFVHVFARIYIMIDLDHFRRIIYRAALSLGLRNLTTRM